MLADNNSTDKKGAATVADLFFDLVRCGMGKCCSLSRVPGAVEWGELYEIANKQTLEGIAFAGIGRLPQEQRPPKRLLLSWHATNEQIKEKNIELNKRCVAVSDRFSQLGFRNCILKGQGVAQLYPNPYTRTPGDIDIWLEGGCDKVLSYIKKCFPNCKPTYHHVDFPIKKGLGIEVHFTPSWMHSPCGNRRLQKYMDKHAEEQFCNYVTTAEGGFFTPTASFNRIYILLHIYRHLFQEGVGLRQLLDYYYVVDKGLTIQEKEECVKMLKKLGLKNFAAAVMYVLKEKFCLDDDKLIVPADAGRGEFLLKEIMIAGNFGKYDSRYETIPKENEFAHFVNSMKRTLRLATQYPGETLWSPYFKIWHFFWRKRHS